MGDYSKQTTNCCKIAYGNFINFIFIGQLLYQQITQTEVDLPLINPEYKSSFTYPPLIKLRVTITKTSDAEAVDSFCYLEVVGIDHKLKMMVEIASPQKLKGLDSQISGKGNWLNIIRISKLNNAI